MSATITCAACLLMLWDLLWGKDNGASAITKEIAEAKELQAATAYLIVKLYKLQDSLGITYLILSSKPLWALQIVKHSFRGAPEAAVSAICNKVFCSNKHLEESDG